MYKKTLQSTVVALLLVSGAVAGMGAEPLLAAAAGESYHVRNRESGELLRPRDASNQDGAPIVLYPRQPWKCLIWQLAEAGADRFRLRNHFTSKSLGPSGEGALQQVACAKDLHDVPAWTFTRLADGAYRIGEPEGDRVWTADASGTRVVLAPWRDADAQKWELIEAPANPTM